jgi:hypothetical protein
MFPRPEPNSFRYFLARFKTFAKPRFWVAGLGLVGLLAFTWQFSQRSEWREALTGASESESTPESKEAQAIGAEIDSLPLLNADLNPKKDNKVSFSDADAIAKIKLPVVPGDQGSKPTENNSLAQLFGGIGVPANTPNNSATFTALNTPLSNPLLGNSNSGSGASSTSSIPSNPATNSNNRPNQLAEAISRYTVARPNPNAPIPVTPSEPSNNGFAPASTGLPIQGSAPINSASSNSSNPWTPVAGSTNVSPTGINAYTGLTSGGIPDSTVVAAPIPLNTGIGSTPLPPGTTPIAPPPPPTATPVIAPDLPFSAPRSIPGRSIGGGEIGSFSNP